MTTINDTASLEIKPINTQVTDRKLIVRKTIAKRAIIRKTIVMATIKKMTAMVTIARKTIVAMITIRKAIVAISGNRMIMNDIRMIPMTNRLASIDKIMGSLAIIRPERPILSIAKTTPLVLTLTMKMILIPLPIHQSPPFMAIQLI